MCKTESVLWKYVALHAATSEEEAADLLRILDPLKDEIEMGKVFEETIGYDPISHYDKKRLRKEYVALVGNTDKDQRDVVVDAVYDTFVEKKPEILAALMEDHLSPQSDNDSMDDDDDDDDGMIFDDDFDDDEF